jgi:protein phosphatase
VLLLCSDGLHGALPDREIARMIGQTAPLKDVARDLVRLANERDGSDNISLQLIRIRGVERVGLYRGRQYSLR